MSRSILLELLGGTKSSHALRRWINLWPPFLGAGIRVKYIAPDMEGRRRRNEAAILER
jgi:hypothetical protein